MTGLFWPLTRILYTYKHLKAITFNIICVFNLFDEKHVLNLYLVIISGTLKKYVLIFILVIYYLKI